MIGSQCSGGTARPAMPLAVDTEARLPRVDYILNIAGGVFTCIHFFFTWTEHAKVTYYWLLNATRTGRKLGSFAYAK